MTLLDVSGLQTHFVTRGIDNTVTVAKALNGVSFSIDRGEILGLVGESGAGKSLAAYTILNLLSPPARRVAGKALFDGTDIFTLDRDAIRRIRGGRIALVVQSARSSLDPVTRIGAQLCRVYRTHRGGTAAKARERALELLRQVGIPDPAGRMRSYPHELSGGMAQRVMIAMALIAEPDLVVADEPTTGLDATVQMQVLDLLRATVLERNMGAILVTHDLGVVAQYCDRVAVMFAGQIVEQGPVSVVFGDPAHPYTRALLSATPERLLTGGRAPAADAPPDLRALDDGCHYRSRCPIADHNCLSPPPLKASGRHEVLCFKPRFAVEFMEMAQ